MLKNRLLFAGWVLLAASVVPILAQTPGPSPAAALKADPALFDYDPKEPLDVSEKLLTEEPGLRVMEISFASPLGGRVPGFLVVPSGKGPFAALVYMHWGQGNKGEFLDEAKEMARHGSVSVMIDAPNLRPDRQRVTSDRWHTQLILDLRRVVDLLTARPDVDPQRIGYVGHSLGATWGGVVAGVEPRFRAFVLMAGYAYPSRYYRGFKPSPNLDSALFIGRAKAPILFQLAAKDEFVTKEQAEEYVRLAPESKESRTYDAGHLLNAAAQKDRIDWLLRRIGAAE